MKNTIRLISLNLVILMLISLLPVAAFADSLTPGSTVSFYAEAYSSVEYDFVPQSDGVYSFEVSQCIYSPDGTLISYCSPASLYVYLNNGDGYEYAGGIYCGDNRVSKKYVNLQAGNTYAVGVYAYESGMCTLTVKEDCAESIGITESVALSMGGNIFTLTPEKSGWYFYSMPDYVSISFYNSNMMPYWNYYENYVEDGRSGNAYFNGGETYYVYAYAENGPADMLFKPVDSPLVEGTAIPDIDYCSYLEYISIPDTVKGKDIYGEVFFRCDNLRSIDVDRNNDELYSASGVLYNKDMTAILRYPPAKSDESFTIPDTVTDIKFQAFSGCQNLKDLTVPSGIQTVPNCAFCECYSLESICLPDGITGLEECSFSYCENLKNINIPDSVTDIEYASFAGCSSLESIALPENLEAINESVFQDSGISSLIVPNGVKLIDLRAFLGCNNLSSIILPASLEEVNYSAFKMCPNLTDVYFLGTPEQWAAIDIKEYNDALKNAEVHYIRDTVQYTVDVTIEGKGSVSGAGTYYNGEVVTLKAEPDEDYYFSGWQSVSGGALVEYGSEYRFVIVQDTALVAKFGHDHRYSETVVPATCTESGYTAYVCDLCGDTYHSDFTEPLGHNFGAWQVTVPYTCTKDGVETRYCSRCDAIETRALPARHDYAATVTEATCTEQGYTSHKCNVCGDEYVDSYVDALGHDYVNDYCSRCGKYNPFVDVSDTAVYFDAVIWASNEGITSGYGNNDFRPKNPCTRAQVVTFLWRAMGCPEPTTTNNPFSDVSAKQANGKDNPYYKAILWAAEKGITTGYDGGVFKPNATVTRAQFVTFLWRAEGKPATTGSINGFTDASTIATPFQTAVAWAVEKGITTGYEDNTFRPNAVCTRWAVVLFMYRDMA